jgi:hypothetical protein
MVIEVVDDTVHLQVELTHFFQQSGVRIVLTIQDSLVGIPVRRIGAGIRRIVVLVLELMPADTDFGLE